MTRLGVTQSVQYFVFNVTAHVVAEGRHPGMWALCGARLSACQDEAELRAIRSNEHREQKMCTRCAKRRGRGEA